MFFNTNFLIAMARITVEDCVKIIPNRFELCLVASSRAKNILSGAHTSHDNKEKPAVISLREIADDVLNVETQKENIVRAFRNQGAISATQTNESVIEAIADESESGLIQVDETFVSENIEVED